MKKPILIIALSAIAVCGLSTGCANNADKLAEANQETKDAKEELANAQVDAAVNAQRAATAEEWKFFRLESDVKIQKREAEIAALKQSIHKTGGESDEIFAEKILELEQRNKDLNAKINNYEASQSDWATFKSEYDYDMESMNKAIKDLGTNNVK